MSLNWQLTLTIYFDLQSVAVINPVTQSTLEKPKSYRLYPSRKAKLELSRNLETGAEAKTTREILTAVFWHTFPGLLSTFLRPLRPTSGLAPPTLIWNHENVSKTCPQTSMMESIPWLKFPSPKETLVCVKLTKLTSFLVQSLCAQKSHVMRSGTEWPDVWSFSDCIHTAAAFLVDADLALRT